MSTLKGFPASRCSGSVPSDDARAGGLGLLFRSVAVGVFVLLVARESWCQQNQGELDSKIIYARSGDHVRLPCNQSLPATPSPSSLLPSLPFLLQWRRLDLPIPLYIGFGNNPPYVDPQYAGRVTVGADLSLAIDGVVADDDGLYECQVIVLNGNYEDIGNGTFQSLVIIGPPRFVTTPPALVIFHEGTSQSLRCIAKGTPTPTVTWRRDGRPAADGDRLRATADSIEFEGVIADDSGMYVCTAESEEGEVEHTVRLLVHGAPFIFIPPHNLTVLRDQSAVLECEAGASPDNATQRWYHGGRHVEAVPRLQGRYEYLPVGGLIIRHAVPADEGWYACSPTNGLGVAPMARGYLDVQYPAYVTTMPASTYVSRSLDVVLSCPTDADPPLLYVDWFREGIEINTQQSNRYTIMADGSLIIADARLDDSAPYTCTPYNKIGTDGMSDTTLLIVRDPPQFLIQPRPLYQRLLGSDVTLPCTASGDPTPTVTWRQMNSDVTPVRWTTNRNGLTIRGVTKEDHGSYKCSATNQIATITISTELVVEGTSPHKPYNVTVATTIGSARVAWQPAYNGGYAQTYTVCYREVLIKETEWSKSSRIPSGDAAAYVLQDLLPSTEYQFAVVASNQLGDSRFSETVAATTKDVDDVVSPTDETGRTVIPIYMGLTPSPPQNLTVSPTPEGLLLAWYPPAEWSQFVERYSIEYQLAGPWAVLYDRVGGLESDRLLLGGLEPNRTYQFRMFAFTPLLYSRPSEIVGGFTGDIPAYAHVVPPKPTTRYGEPGILAGILAAVVFLLVVLLLGVLAICISYRKKRRKRPAFFSVTATTPQPLIHRPQPVQTPDAPQIHPAAPKKPSTPTITAGGIVSKLIIKLSPKRAAPASCNNNNHHHHHHHPAQNGRVPNGRQAASELSESLLARAGTVPTTLEDAHDGSGGARTSLGSRGGGRGGSRSLSPKRAGRGRTGRLRFASEQALELEEFRPSAPSAGVYSVRDGRVRTQHDIHYNSSDARSNSDTESYGRQWRDCPPPEFRSDESAAATGAARGDYVYYHGEMFITGHSEDNDDYGWAGDVVGGGTVNPGLDVDDSINNRRRWDDRAAPNQYVDMPVGNAQRWDQEWADDTLSHHHHHHHHHATPPPPVRSGTLPRQSTKKDVRALDHYHNHHHHRSGYYGDTPPPAYVASLPVGAVGGSSPAVISGRRFHRDDELDRSPMAAGKVTSDYVDLRVDARRTSSSGGRTSHEGDPPRRGHGRSPDGLAHRISYVSPYDGCSYSSSSGRIGDGTLSTGRASRSRTRGYREPAQQVTRRSPVRARDGSPLGGWGMGHGTDGRDAALVARAKRLDDGTGIPQQSLRDPSPLADGRTYHTGNRRLEELPPTGARMSKGTSRSPSPSKAKLKLADVGSFPPHRTNFPPRLSIGGAVAPSLSPATNSRASVTSSLDSRPESSRPTRLLPESYLLAQRGLLSPNSQCSASSGYGSRNTSQSTASRGRTSSVPSIHSGGTPGVVDSPFSDSSGVGGGGGDVPSCKLDQGDLLDALENYYAPVELGPPSATADETYRVGSGKVAEMERRCEKLKKEFQEYQENQAKARKRRLTSSV